MAPRVLPSMIVAFIEDAFPDWRDQTRWSRFGDANLPGNLNALAVLIDQLPEALWPADPVTSVRLQRSHAAIRTTLSLWTHHAKPGEVGLQRTPEGHPIAVIHGCLAHVPDAPPIDSASMLPFVADAELRDQLARDIGVSETALSSAEWRVATVFAGASVEAILLLQLSQQLDIRSAGFVSFAKDNGVTSAPDRWGIVEYAKLCHAKGWIDSETKDLVLKVQNFRNLIHPDRAIRLREECNRGTAHIAFGCAHFLVERLSRSIRKTMLPSPAG